MRTLLLAFLFLGSTTLSNAQNLESFFKNYGVKLVAFMAHPTNEYLGGYYTIGTDYVTLEFTTKDSWTGSAVKTKINFRRKGVLFYSLDVAYDQDSGIAFLAVSAIKGIIDEVIKEADSENQYAAKSALERYLEKSYYEFDGEDLTLFFLTLAALES